MDIKSFIKSIVGENAKITKLHGDASYRTFYRAVGKEKSIIVMQMPDGISSVSEEVTDLEKPSELPYINLSRFLKSKNLPVPDIYKVSDDEKLIAIQDLGDDLIYNLLQKSDSKKTEEYYKKAIDLLVCVQSKTRLPDDDCFAYQRKFSKKLLKWELEHFWEYAVLARGFKPSDSVKNEFDNFSDWLINEIETMPYSFVHRDFQSKNLILKNEKLFMVDFQDALMGPYIYDLVALLRDSYVALNNEQLENLIKYYEEKCEFDDNDIRRHFALVTVQRKLKDAGRFVYIDKVKGNSDYLKYIQDSLKYVHYALNIVSDSHHIIDVLKPYVPEWENLV